MRLSSGRRTPLTTPPNEAGVPPFHFERDEVMAYLQQQSITTPDWRFEVDVPSKAWMIHDVRRD
jgi:hypothetical protein